MATIWVVDPLACDGPFLASLDYVKGDLKKCTRNDANFFNGEFFCC